MVKPSVTIQLRKADKLASIGATNDCHNGASAAADPLARAQGLAEAADKALVLSTDELVALGVKGDEGFSDGHLVYCYVFSKHTQRNRTLWTVERAIKQKAADGQPSLASVHTVLQAGT